MQSLKVNYSIESDALQSIKRSGIDVGSFEGKTVLITGGTGSLGRAIIQKLKKYNCNKILIKIIDKNLNYSNTNSNIVINTYTTYDDAYSSIFDTDIENNKKMREVWEEIDSLRERIRHLENRPQVQPPSKVYPDWNKPNWTPYNPVPPWTVTCGNGTLTTNNEKSYQYNTRHTSGYCQPENGPAVTGTIKND